MQSRLIRSLTCIMLLQLTLAGCVRDPLPSDAVECDGDPAPPGLPGVLELLPVFAADDQETASAIAEALGRGPAQPEPSEPGAKSWRLQGGRLDLAHSNPDDSLSHHVRWTFASAERLDMNESATRDWLQQFMERIGADPSQFEFLATSPGTLLFVQLVDEAPVWGAEGQLETSMMTRLVIHPLYREIPAARLSQDDVLETVLRLHRCSVDGVPQGETSYGGLTIYDHRLVHFVTIQPPVDPDSPSYKVPCAPPTHVRVDDLTSFVLPPISRGC